MHKTIESQTLLSQYHHRTQTVGLLNALLHQILELSPWPIQPAYESYRMKIKYVLRGLNTEQ